MKLTQNVKFLDLVIPAGTIVPDAKDDIPTRPGQKLVITVGTFISWICSGKLCAYPNNRGKQCKSQATSNSCYAKINADVLGDCTIAKPMKKHAWRTYVKNDKRNNTMTMTGFHSRAHGILRRLIDNIITPEDYAAKMTVTVSDNFLRAYCNQGIRGSAHTRSSKTSNPDLAIGYGLSKILDLASSAARKRLNTGTYATAVGHVVREILRPEGNCDYGPIYRNRELFEVVAAMPAADLPLKHADAVRVAQAVEYATTVFLAGEKHPALPAGAKLFKRPGVFGFIVADRVFKTGYCSEDPVRTANMFVQNILKHKLEEAGLAITHSLNEDIFSGYVRLKAALTGKLEKRFSVKYPAKSSKTA